MAIIKQAGTTGDRDAKTGLASIVQTYVVDTLEEAYSCGKDDVPLNLKEVRRPFSRYMNHPTKLLVSVQYEGSVDDDGGEPDAETSGAIEFDVVLEEQPIEAHPQIEDLLKRYGGTVNPQTKRVTFPLEAPSTSGTGAALSKSSKPTAKNPLYGLTSFVTLGSVFRRTYFVKTVPPDLLERVGTMKQNLPRGLPTPAGRVWLVMPPRLVERGNGFEIAEEWKLVRDEPGLRVVYSMLRE